MQKAIFIQTEDKSSFLLLLLAKLHCCYDALLRRTLQGFVLY